MVAYSCQILKYTYNNKNRNKEKEKRRKENTYEFYSIINNIKTYAKNK